MNRLRTGRMLKFRSGERVFHRDVAIRVGVLALFRRSRAMHVFVSFLKRHFRSLIFLGRYGMQEKLRNPRRHRRELPSLRFAGNFGFLA